MTDEQTDIFQALALEEAEEAAQAPEVECCPTCGRPLGDLEEGGVKGREATSRAAAEFGQGSDRHRALWFLSRLGPSTADAVAWGLQRSPNQTATRLLELRNGGYVEYARNSDGTRATAVTRTGRKAYVQQLTAVGLAKVRALGPPEQSRTPS